MDDGQFWELTSELEHQYRAEAEAEAASVIAAAESERTFADGLRALSPGDVITLSCADGVQIQGRILGVGKDVVRLGEVADALGSARVQLVRVHDIRIDAIVRMQRER